MKLSMILAPLIAAKVPHEVIMETILAFEAQQDDALEKRREADRNRQARKRQKDAVTLSHVTRLPSRSHARVEDISSNQEISGKVEEERKRAAKPRSDLDAFRDELSEILDAERIEALVAVRRKKGAVMTANTGRLLVAAIRRCHLPPAEVADEMALRNWTSVKPDWLENRARPQATSPPSDLERMNTALDQMIAGKSDEPGTYRTIDASFDRSDRGSAESVVQFPALPARY